MEKHKPERKFKAGAVTATIWKNEAVRQDGSKGEFYTVTLERRYKDRNGEWATSNSLRVNDLPKAVLVLDKAYEYITFKDLGIPGAEAIEEESDEEVEEV
ncbi:hypothetical protein DRJ48_00275 [Candidatus Woesearchaeota archaeon]|nr:hypothetical protein [Candidatus Woesearchaeota archaeon]RLE43685.1 MAG: hypothetical protein DRJ48_00275 [Candidatus Woesearchaeota archaeon]